MDSPNPMEPNVNPYPTTFVQAETSTFKHVVQLLTGSPNTVSAATSKPSPSPSPAPVDQQQQQQQQHLYQRRNLRIIRPVNVTPSAAPISPVLSPSMLDFPSLVLSPVTPLLPDPFNKPPLGSPAASFAEDNAIAQKGFYLHPSPRGSDPPQLLPLFPLTSPTAPKLS